MNTWRFCAPLWTSGGLRLMSGEDHPRPEDPGPTGKSPTNPCGPQSHQDQSPWKQRAGEPPCTRIRADKHLHGMYVHVYTLMYVRRLSRSTDPRFFCSVATLVKNSLNFQILRRHRSGLSRTFCLVLQLGASSCSESVASPRRVWKSFLSDELRETEAGGVKPEPPGSDPEL